MKIQLKKNTLSKILEVFAKIAKEPEKRWEEDLRKVLIIANKDELGGEIVFSTYGNKNRTQEIQAKYCLNTSEEVVILEEGKVVFPALTIYNAIKDIPNCTITLEIIKNRCDITFDNSTLNINILDSTGITPNDPLYYLTSEEYIHTSFSKKSFDNMTRKTLWGCRPDKYECRILDSQIQFKFNENEGCQVFATDGSQASNCIFLQPEQYSLLDSEFRILSPKSFIKLAKSIFKILKLKGNDYIILNFSKDRKIVQFIADYLIFTLILDEPLAWSYARDNNGNLKDPDYSIVCKELVENLNKTFTVERNKLLQFVKYTKKEMIKHHDTIKIELNTDSITLNYDDKNKTTFPCEFKGDPYAIWVNVKYFLNMLTLIEKEKITFQFEKNTNGKFYPLYATDKNTKFLLMPCAGNE